MRETIPLNQIATFEKHNTKVVVPNAIEVVTVNDQRVCDNQSGLTLQFFFHGFGNRDHVFKVLQQMKSDEVKNKTVRLPTEIIDGCSSRVKLHCSQLL